MALDISWYRVNQLSDLIEEATYATSQEAFSIAITISDMILNVGDQALSEAIDHADGVKNTLTTLINGKIADVMIYINEETDLIYDQLDLWLEDVEDWITLLITDVTTSIEENVGMSEENIEGIGSVIGDNIGAGIEETGSWIGNVYDNIKTSIFDTTSNLIDRIAGLVEMIKDAPELIIAKMLTELIPAEAARWLLTAGSVLTGADMGQWFVNLRTIITSAGEQLFEFNTEDVMNNFVKAFKVMKQKLPELLS